MTHEITRINLSFLFQSLKLQRMHTLTAGKVTKSCWSGEQCRPYLEISTDRK